MIGAVIALALAIIGAALLAARALHDIADAIRQHGEDTRAAHGLGTILRQAAADDRQEGCR